MTYAILKAAPIPAARKRGAVAKTEWKFPFTKLKVGQSFVVPATDPASQLYGQSTKKTGSCPVTAAMYRFNLHEKEQRGDKADKMTYCKMEDGSIRVWRVE